MMMGLTPVALWLSWFITYFVIFSLLAGIIATTH
jgi:hypothetical protein